MQLPRPLLALVSRHRPRAIAAAPRCSPAVPRRCGVAARHSMAAAAPAAAPVAAAAQPAPTATDASSDAVAALSAWSNSRFVGGLDRPAADGSALPPLVQYSSSAARNQKDIGAALLTLLPPASAGSNAPRDPLRVLELSSGTGQHIAHFASLLPHATFQPTDQTRDGFASIEYHTREVSNVRAPVTLDLEAEDVSALLTEGSALVPHSFDLICVANMLHISGPRTSAGMFAAAAAALRKPEQGGGRLLAYGPFKIDGQFTTESNRAFDQKLKSMSVRFASHGLLRVLLLLLLLLPLALRCSFRFCVLSCLCAFVSACQES